MQDRLFTGWRGWLLATYVAIGVLIGFAGFMEQARYNGLLGHDLSGRRAAGITPVENRFGWFRVTAVSPGESADRSGWKPGDLVRFDIPADAVTGRVQGHVSGVTIERGGVAFRSTLRTYPSSQGQGLDTLHLANLVGALGMVLCWSTGLLVVIRTWGNLPGVLLGLGLLALGMPADVAPWFLPPVPSLALASAFNATAMPGLVIFPAALAAASGERVRRFWYVVFASLLASLCISITLFVWAVVMTAPPPGLRDGLQSSMLGGLFLGYFWTVGSITALYWVIRGLKESAGQFRNRFGTVLVAYIILALQGLVFALPAFLGIGWTFEALQAASNLIYWTTPLLLAYAVLRHKVIDVGFAINRTLLFGIVSAILLVAFGLLEWAAHHLLPEEWSKASAWIDGGIALSLYLGFHRVRDFVEHHLEHLFFHAWQANEAKLRRFITSAAHFEAEDALAQAFAAELARFSADAPVAVYTRQAQTLVLASANHAEAPASLPEADPAFALMRAERAPLDLADTATTLPGVLALPMLDHGALAGFALLGPKPDGNLYRPDEIDVLGWAAHQVGLDLAALRARHIERENRTLRAQVDKLGELLARTGLANA